MSGKTRIFIVALAAVAVGATILSLQRRGVESPQVVALADSVEKVEKPVAMRASSSSPVQRPRWAQLQAEAVAVGALPDEQRDAALVKLVQSCPLSELPEVLKSLAGVTDEASLELRRLLLRRWAASDPWAAGNWAGSLALSSGRVDLLQQVALAWSQTHLAEAIKWGQSLPEAAERQGVCLALANEAVRSDPTTALKLAAELTMGQGVRDLVVHAASEWAAVDPASAAAWGGEIQDAALRNEVLSGIATEWGARDPFEASTLAVQAIDAGKPQNDAVVGIVQRWAATDPVAAAGWVLAFPEGSLQQIALENLVKPWASLNPEQVGQWLNALEPGDARDASVAAYAMVVSPEMPEVAASWAASIAQEALRIRELGAVVNGWLARDSVSARDWLAQSSLSSAEKKQLLAGAAAEQSH